MNAETVPLNPPHLTADELRSKIVALFEEFKPNLQGYYEYAQRAAALNEEYHQRRLESVGPPIETGTLALTLDARETPATLDNKLAQIPQGTIRRVVFDRANSRYYLFV